MLSPADELPTALRKNARWDRLGASRIPVMLVDPEAAGPAPAPIVIWMHGRTARKELDPGRYLRLMRCGIAVCAVDLPGHGERFDAAWQDPRHTLDVILQMEGEIDELIAALPGRGAYDPHRMAIGGMSAGGMAALARLCHDHPFVAAAIEAASGSWEHQRHREMFRERGIDEIARENPVDNLDGWREIPLQAIHARGDEWVMFEGQERFIDELRRRYEHPERVELVVYDQTGAPFEHAGFGRMASDAKERQRDFFRRVLLDGVHA